MSTKAANPLLTKFVRYSPVVAGALGLLASFLVWTHWQLSPQMLNAWEATTYDWRLQLDDSVSVSPHVLTIGRDVESVQRLGAGVWDRAIFARVIAALGEAGATVVAPDFYFSGQSPTNRGGKLSDDALVAATKSAGGVVYPVVISMRDGEDTRIPPKLHPFLWAAVAKTFPPLVSPIASLKHAHIMGGLYPDLATHAVGLGHIAALSDEDGVYRRVPLYVNVGDQALPSFGLSMVTTFLGVMPDRITVQPGKRITLHDANFPDGKIRDVSVPIDDQGQLLINYAGQWTEGVIPYFSFVDIWDAVQEGRLDELRGVVDGNIVILLPAAIDGDKRQTPLELKAPGGFIHANLVNTILTGQWLHEASPLVWATSTVVLAGFAAWLFLLASSWLGVLIIIVLLIFYVAVVYVSFIAGGVILPVLAPLYAAVLSAGFVISVHNRFILSVFGKFLAPTIVSSIVRSRDGLELGGSKQKITILMSDLRGFTSMCAGLDPQHVVTLLNRYLETMIDIIEDHGGIVNDFMGDAILVTFGAVRSRPDDAQRAVACAVSMQLAMAGVNERNRQDGLPPIYMGIGINTGEVVVGNIGSSKRMKYDVIGSHVNLASRIESNTVAGQVLISESTKHDAASAVLVGKKIEVLAKGFTDPVTIYDVLGVEGAETIMLPRKEQQLTLLREPVPLRYVVLDGKSCDGSWLDGHLVEVSLNRGVLELGEPLPAFTNLKINLVRQDGEEIPGDLYAKIVETFSESTNDSTSCSVQFSSMPPSLAAYVSEHVAVGTSDTMG